VKALLRICLLLAIISTARASIIVPSPGFGPYGDAGFGTSQVASDAITFGDGHGYIFQMDAFLNVDGICDYGTGITQDLACGPPAGIAYTFAATQPTSHQLLLTYSFVNNTGAVLSSLDLMFYVDPDIGSIINDEWATVAGSVGDGAYSYQVGNPTLSSIFYNAITNNLNSTNQEPSTAPGDVAIALGLSDGTVAIGGTATFQVLLSDNGASIGNLSITQHDPVYTGDSLTVSGDTTPEPSTVILVSSGLLTLLLRGRRAGIL
jgi:hypothetical protein